MSRAHMIIGVSLSGASNAQLGILEFETPDTTIRFELNEEIAHNLCADLEHFLTQREPRGGAARRLFP